jgi:hypothetical protein
MLMSLGGVLYMLMRCLLIGPNTNEGGASFVLQHDPS